MSGFILELGQEETVAGGMKSFVSRGFYVDYTVQGPVVTATREHAYVFPRQDNAHNVQQGDERLRPSRVVPI